MLKYQRLSNNWQPDFTDQELITIYLFGHFQGHFSQKRIYGCISQHFRAWFPDLPSYQAFNRRLADDGLSALSQIRTVLPDVAILDVDMPGQSGFEIAQIIKAEKLPVKIIFLTMHNSETMLSRVLNLGVKGYVLKDGALAEIVQAIKSVMRGEEFISPALTRHLISRLRRSEDLTNQKPTIKDLTPTELKVIRSIAHHKSSKEIAAEMFVSVRTVEQHRANVAEKLHLRGNNALRRFALENRDEML